MRRSIFCVIFFAMAIGITGCSNKIIEEYPEVKSDFTKEDYKELNSLSNNGQLSYEELCNEFIKNNADEEVNRIIKELSTIGELSNLTCKKTDNKFVFSYDYEIEDGKTTTTFTTDVKEFKIKNINFNSKGLKFTAVDDMVEIIEGNKDIANKINSSINTDFNIENRIYASSKKYFYLPIENNEVRIFSSKNDIDSKYKSSTEFWNNQLEENEKDIDELEESLEKTEELFGSY